MPRDRAIAVCLDGDAVLVMRRHKSHRDYTVLPGGGMEPGEDAATAAVRELAEETGLAGRVVRHLATLERPGGREVYFQVGVTPGPLVLGSPEVERQSDDNRYDPIWIPVASLDREPLVPEEIPAIIRAAQNS